MVLLKMHHLPKNIFQVRYVILIILILIISISFFFMSQKPLVSVVMPTYNRAEFLPIAINSILNQTYSNFEFIIVDDGSTDNTSQLLQAYKQKDKRIQLIFLPKNSGVSVARTTGNFIAQGKYIVVMDSDDIALPSLLKKSVSFMEKNPHITIGIPKSRFYQDGLDPYKNNYPWPRIIHTIIRESSIGNVGIIFKRDFIKKHHIVYNSQLCRAEDYDFWIKMIKEGASLSYIGGEDPLVFARRHTNNPPHEYYLGLIYEKKIQMDFLKFLNIPPLKEKDLCFIFKKLIRFNPNIFDPFLINVGLKEYCPPSNHPYILLKHPFWSDYLLFSPTLNRVYRYKIPTEKATIIYFVPQKKITLKWDKFGIETFEYLKEDTYQLKKVKRELRIIKE